VASQGVVFVGSHKPGVVYALRDADGDGVAEETLIVAEGLHLPTGVAFRDGALFVAEVDRILRYDRILEHLERPGPPTTVYGDLPREDSHGLRYLAFAPDGKIHVAVGAPCNTCERGPPFASLLRVDAATGRSETVAEGIRNSEGYAFDPVTGALWFTDNGRDWLGDYLPTDELNHAPVTGMHFGFPYVHGKDVLDPGYGKGIDPAHYTPPALALGAHVAPLGMSFYTGDQFPAHMKDRLFIALHGSWNRSRKVGYAVVSVRFAAGRKAVAMEPFAEGWLQGERVLGRPVDVKMMPDGSLLISDDEVGAVYRVVYDGTGQ
jgi:glucose/arabinose dehydrogenase